MNLAEFQKLIEANLPYSQSHDATRGHLQSALMTAHGVTDRWSSNGPYVQDVFPGHVIYRHGNQTLKRQYTMDAKTDPPTVKLGTHKAVHSAYVDSPTMESKAAIVGVFPESWLGAAPGVVTTPDKPELFTESIAFDDFPADKLLEAKAGTSPYVALKLISPGWGSSGYYSADMLERDGPSIYKKNAHMYWNHSKEDNRDPNELAAVLTEDSVWNADGPKGPGLYAQAKVFSDYATQVAEKGKHIGVSINAYGKSVEGTAEGRKGKIIQKLLAAESVDFVSKAGRGGEILTESERRGEPHHTEGDSTMSMTDAEATSLREAQTRNAALVQENAGLLLEKNQALATATFIEALRLEGHQVSVGVAKAIMSSPPLKEGKVDVAAIAALAKETKADFTKIAKESRGGKVVDLGGANRAAEEGDVAEDKANLEKLEKSMRGMGLSEAAAKIAVEGRV